MNDQNILEQITAMVQEEHLLRESSASPEEKAEQLKHIEEQLDQCWDLLRQRRARREFGEDPDEATPRDISTIEHYQR